MTPSETLDLIAKLRADGARRVRVGDVEVEWASAPHSEPLPAQKLTADERERRAKEAEDDLLFAASG